MTTIRTGLVYQRTAKGPNYVCLGKANVGGQTMIISVKNGNIRANGKCKEQGAGEAVVLYAHAPKDIARVHQAREVDVKTVFTVGGALPEFQHTTKRMLQNGVATEAELPRLAELR
jgi:hypothetical protein